jgi:hypothetical protein
MDEFNIRVGGGSGGKTLQQKSSNVGAGKKGADIHRDEFPARWKAYIRANYRDLKHVQKVFGITERAAGKWWAGKTGCGGGQVAVAMNQHPDEALRMLFGPQ